MRRVPSRANIAFVALLCFLAATAVDWLSGPAAHHHPDEIARLAMWAFLIAPPVVTICLPRLWLLAWIAALLCWLHYVQTLAFRDDNLGATLSFVLLVALNAPLLLGRAVIVAWDAFSADIDGYRG